MRFRSRSRFRSRRRAPVGRRRRSYGRFKHRSRIGTRM